jgi:hypothetical protein
MPDGPVASGAQRETTERRSTFRLVADLPLSDLGRVLLAVWESESRRSEGTPAARTDHAGMSGDHAYHISRCFVSAAAGGLIDAQWCTAHYAETLARLPTSLGSGEVDRDDLLLRRDEKISVYLTPFDDYNARAKVFLVGLTPGRQKMHLAVTTAGCT